jgi:hypothetical protein
MSASPELAGAKARSVAARERLMSTVAEAKRRLNPSTIAANAVDDAKVRAKDGVAKAADHPGTVAAVTGGAMVFFLRRPLFRLLRGATRRTPAVDHLNSLQRNPS